MFSRSVSFPEKKTWIILTISAYSHFITQKYGADFDNINQTEISSTDLLERLNLMIHWGGQIVHGERLAFPVNL